MERPIKKGWGGSFASSSPSPSPKRLREKPRKSAFSARSRNEDQDNENDSEESPRKSSPRKSRRHVSIEVEKESDPSPEASSKGVRRGRRSRFRETSDDDEEIVGGNVDRFNVSGGGTTTDTEGNIVEINKTTTALLLAEEASQILGSPVDVDGSSRNYWTSVSFTPPMHWTNEEWEEWKSLTFYPSSTDPIPEASKIEEDVEKGMPAEEGLFEGEPSQMANRNWNRLYWRLMKQNAGYWFGSDGKLLCYPDPYRKEVVQLFKEDNESLSLIEEVPKMVRFVPAKLDPFLLQNGSTFPSSSSYELEVDLGYVNFAHHPFFSKEHVIGSTLQTAFEKYSRRQQERVTERAVNKLRALRDGVAHTKATLSLTNEQLETKASSHSPSTKKRLRETARQHEMRLDSYRNEMRKVSLSRDQGYWDDKASIAAVLDIWKELKNIREHQGYTNTSLKLNIIELPSDPKEELDNWVRDIEDDIQDIEEESEELFEKEMSKYRAKMKRWTAKDTTKAGTGTGDAPNGSNESDDASISRRPRPPSKPGIGDVKKLIEKRYKEIRRRPGEPNILLELTNTATVTAMNQLPEEAIKEKQRRKALKKCKVEVLLFLNETLIYSSKPRTIHPDFSVFLGFKVPISVNERPELLELEVLDLETKIRTMRILIEIPDSKTTIERCNLKRVMFFADDVIKVANAGVGTGSSFEINGHERDGLNTKGTVTLRCGWAIDGEGNAYQKGDRRSSTEEDSHFFGKRSVISLGDPNDPKNAYRRRDSKVQELGGESLSSPPNIFEDEIPTAPFEDEFSLDKLMKEFEFCDDDVIEKSPRFKLLLLRDQGVPEFKNMKMISSMEKDISMEIFTAYEKRLKEDLNKRTAGGEKGVVTFGRKRQIEDDFVYESNRLERIKEMRLGVLRLFEKSLKQITFEDLVIEEQIPDIGTLGLNLMQFFQPRRPLRPIRKERKRVQASTLVDTKIDLIFNIVRAFNLPLRTDSDFGQITTESLTGVQIQKKRLEKGNYSTVRPFVEVWFQRRKARTTTAMGQNPTWNQEVQLNLTVPNDDYSQATLSKMDDPIFLLMYDEVPVDLLEDNRRRETDIYQRIERHWLGSITIPFSTLYTNGRIEGTFKLNMPPVLLGYEPQGMSSHFGGLINKSNSLSLKSPGSAIPFQNQNAFVTIFITLQPAVQPTISPRDDSATGETAEMIAFVKNWKNIFEKQFPERFIRPFVLTANGDTILSTRYLTTIQPPDEFLDNGIDTLHAMEQLAHYVSLFPFVRDSTLGITDYSLWFTSDVFVATPGGGVDDHAVLLACYFHYLNIPCWMVQGNAIPDGPTTFVVTSFKGVNEDKGIPRNFRNAVLLWNPCTGEHFNANDNFCPMQKVWSVIGKQNIWANVTEGERPHQIDWNIGKSKTWLPLFSKPMAEDKMPCVQPGIKRYKNPDQIQANSLAQRIERNLKEAFMKWRSSSKTHWNRYCSATLRRLLPKLEENKSGRVRIHERPSTGSAESTINLSQSGSVTNVNEEHLIELREITSSYQMSGFPLQQSYVNMNLIMESVHSTGVHTIDTPDVEFALAAYAHAYPSSVYSVWVYVAALHRRK